MAIQTVMAVPSQTLVATASGRATVGMGLTRGRRYWETDRLWSDALASSSGEPTAGMELSRGRRCWERARPWTEGLVLS